MKNIDSMSLEELEAYRDELEAQLADERSGGTDDEPADIPNISNLGGASGRSWDGDLPEQPVRTQPGQSRFAPNHETVKLRPTAETDDEGRELTFSERFQAMWADQ